MSQNCVLVDIKSRLALGNACSSFIQNVLLFSLLYKNTNIKTHRPLILPVGLYGCKTWSYTEIRT